MDKIVYKNFYVFSPSTIKKYAVKGNAKKGEILRALIYKERELNLISDFTSVLENNLDVWIKKGEKVEAPVSDLVDATWICLFVEDFWKKLLNENLV